MSCASCGTSPCQCSSQQSSVTPYYNCGTSIQETHCQSITQQIFVTAISSGNSFVMPACNIKAEIYFPGLANIQIGSYLWNVQIGYLNVTDFDFLSQKVTVMNECQDGNIAPGTVINQCALFNVVDPPCFCITAPT